MPKNLHEQYENLKNLNSIYENEEDKEKKKCRDFKENRYISGSLYRIISMAVEVDQNRTFDEVTECNKVIKLKRTNSLSTIKFFHPETVVFEGIYVISPGLFLPRDVMDCIGYNSYSKKYGKLDISGLPTGYSYSTIRSIGDGCGFVLKNSEITESINNRHSSWEYFNLYDYI